MTLKKITGKLHLWLGLSSGLVVFILGITGCILTFEYELRNLIYKDRYIVKEERTQKLPIEQLLVNAQKAISNGEHFSGLEVHNDKQRTIGFSTYQKSQDTWNYFSSIKSYKTVFVNPYTGQIQHIENTKFEFFRLITMLHYNLFLEQIGKWIVGWATVIFIFLLVSGLVLWWPRNRSATKQRFTFRWKDTTRWKRKNYDLHNILGFYSLLFAFIIALTGLVWAFTWVNDTTQWIANGGIASPKEKVFHSDSLANTNTGVYDLILRDMKRRDKTDLYYISLPQKVSEALYAYSQPYNAGHRWTEFYYDQQTGKNLSIKYYDEKLTGEKLRAMNYDIHSGGILGLPGKILAFVISFICAGLPVTGFMIWLGRYRKLKK